MKTQQILHLPSSRLLTLGTALATIGFFSAGTAPLKASNVTWNGSSSANWNLAGNWTSALPITGDSLTFGAAGTSGAVLNNDLTTSAFAIAGITFSSGASAYTINGNSFTLNLDMTNNSTSAQTFSNNIVLGGGGHTLLAASGDIVVSGVLSGASTTSALAIGSATASTGTVTLNGNNTFAGGVQIGYATLNIGNAGALGSGTFNTSNDNAKFDNTAGSALTLSNGLRISSNVTFIGSNNLTFNGLTTVAANKSIAVSANTLTLNGGVVYTGMLSKSGAGTLVLNGASTGAGGLQIGTGTVILGNSTAAGSGTISLASNATLASNTDLSGANKIANAVSISGDGIIGGSNNIEFSGDFTNTTGNNRSLTISNTALSTIDGNIYLNKTSTTGYGLTIKGSGNLTINGAISNYNGTSTGSSWLTLNNTGKVTLAGNNTYTGNTTVSNGTLAVNGSIAASSTVTVSSAATLAGTGTVNGATTLQGTLAAGNGGIGTLSTGSLSLAATSVLDVELGRNGTTATSDLTNVTGSVSIVSGANLKLTLATGLSNLSGGDIIFLIDNDATDAVQGTFTSLNGVITTLSEGSTFIWNSQTWEITYQADSATSNFSGGNDVALMVVVPEPATWSMIIGGLGMMAFAQRARRRMSR